tara:strand:+ start:11582 stop:12316 length:735 start_codon:yes stop_codon:yes gene_type:complete
MVNKKPKFRTRSNGSVYPIYSESKAESVEGYTVKNTYPTKCPGCRVDVYYYQSQSGGKIFFDELGSPWPKHECDALLEIITEDLELIEKKKIFIRARRLRRKREREQVKREKKLNLAWDKVAMIESVGIKGGNYPMFSSAYLEKVMFRHVGGKYIIYKISDIYVDNIKRREIPMVQGSVLRLTDDGMDVIKNYYCDMPVYILGQTASGFKLITHVVENGVVKPYDFLALKIDSVEKILEDVLRM